MAAATWRMAGGRAFKVQREAWRVVSDTAQRLVPQPPAESLRQLVDDPQEEGCQRLRPALEAELRQPGNATPDGSIGAPRVGLYRDGAHCLALLRIAQPIPAGPGGVVDLANARDLVHLRAYLRPRPEDLDDTGRLRLPAVAVANFEYGRMRPHEDRWYTGKRGSDWEGWLVIQREANQHNPVRYNGMPWSTQALLDLGAQVLKYHQSIDLGAGRGLPSAAGPSAARTASPARQASAGSGG